MKVFKRKIEFISAKCPECNGNLEFDSNIEIATCSNCGAQCLVKNFRKKH